MMLLSGLLGMLALGTLALVSFGPDSEDEDEESLAPEEFDDPTEQNATSLDFATPGSEADALPEVQQPPAAPGPVTVLAPTSTQTAQGATALTGIAAFGPVDIAFEGTAEADEYLGTEEDELIFGAEGGDTMLGEDGDDTLHGQSGADDLYGGAADDVLFGGHGQDTLTGDDGNDLLRGGQGTDALHGRDGDDTLDGDMGTDTLFGAAGNDLLIGVKFDEDGIDQDQQDYLNAGSDDDTVIAGDEDVVSLGGGADVLYLGDWMTGPGAEVLDFDDDEDQLMVIYNDSAHSGEPEVTLRLNANNPALTEITLGDQVLATLPTEDAPPLDSVVLIAESSLADLNIGVLSARAG